MPFRTKLDYSDNRQIKQHIATRTVLSGATEFGVQFSALTTGPDLSTSGVSETFTFILSTFSGNSGTTVYTWYDSRMELGASSLSALTPSNSAITQNTGQIYTASSTTIIDGNTISLAYSGVSFDITDIILFDLGGGNYSGSVETQLLTIISANTLDFTGRTIWVDVIGITRTQDLIITKNPVIGYSWKCIDSEGKGAWGVDATGVNITGGTYSNGTTIFTNSTGGTFIVSGYFTGTNRLGTASPFVILAGTDITNGLSVPRLVSGNTGHIGTESAPFTYSFGADYAGAAALNGGLIPPAFAAGTPLGDAHAVLLALNSLTPTFSFAPGAINLATDTTHGPIGIYMPGIYYIDGAASIGTAGITLSGAGEYVFQINGALTTVTTSVITVANGATADMVYWLPVGGASLGATTTFVGNILSGPAAITTDADVNLTGRLISESAITLGAGTPLIGVPSYSSITDADIFTTGATLIGTIVYFDTNTSLSAYTLNLSALSSSGSTSVWTAGTGSSSAVLSGSPNIASGNYSVAEGFNTTASGLASHAEGTSTIASGDSSHAEGLLTTAGDYSHAEGVLTIALQGSHAEGDTSYALGVISHAEGADTTASGTSSHSEGRLTTTLGDYSHAEGEETTTISQSSHAEGFQSITSGYTSHAEGFGTIAGGNASHAEGQFTIATGSQGHAEGYTTLASGQRSHSEGDTTYATGIVSHAEGNLTTASGDYSHAEGYNTTANNLNAHAEGRYTLASNASAHAEGDGSTASGNRSHAEGNLTRAIGDYGCHAEGSQSTASGQTSHAEGSGTTSAGFYSHTEGLYTTAIGNQSHAGGQYTIASGETSFVHGSGSTAGGTNSIVLGANITGITNDTTYVDGLNIKTVGAGPGTIDLGVDANGNVVDQASDRKLKENINTINDALSKVLRLRGVTYNWRDREKGGNAVKLGFIAQEVDEIVPELAYYNPNGDYMGVHYKDVTALLVEAIKELSSGVTTSGNVYLETQTILAEDNNIELNYGGNQETAIGGGIRVLHAMSQDLSAELITDVDGNWITNNDLKAKALTIPTYTPTSSSDTNGSEGNITRDNNYLYIKCVNGWKRSNLESF